MKPVVRNLEPEPMPTPIRVGIINCDTHGAWYGAMMGKHDPYLLREPIERGARSKKTWQSGAVHYYQYTLYHAPTVMTAPFVEGCEITRLWDAERVARGAGTELHFGARDPRDFEGKS